VGQQPRRRAAVVAIQHERGPRLASEGAHPLRVGAAEPIDRLVQIGDRDNGYPVQLEELEDQEFLGSAVLRLIDDDLAEPVGEKLAATPS
jgi:hypothetical protein